MSLVPQLRGQIGCLDDPQKVSQAKALAKGQKFDPTLRGLPPAILAHILSFLHPVEVKPYDRFSAEKVEDITDVAQLSCHFRDFFRALIKTTTLLSLLTKSVCHLNVSADTSFCPAFDSNFWTRIGNDLPSLSTIDMSVDNLSGTKGVRLGEVLSRALTQGKLNNALTLRLFDKSLGDMSGLKLLAGKIGALHLPNAVHIGLSPFYEELGRLNANAPPPDPHFLQHIGNAQLGLHELLLCITQVEHAVTHVESIKTVTTLGLVFHNDYYFNEARYRSALQKLLQVLTDLKEVELQFPPHTSLILDLEELLAIIPPQVTFRITEFSQLKDMKTGKGRFNVKNFQENVHRFHSLKLLHLGIPITQPLLNMLKSLQQLKIVNVITKYQTEFTSQEMTLLVQALPQCRITIDGKLVGEEEERKRKTALKLQPVAPPVTTIFSYFLEQLTKVVNEVWSWFTSKCSWGSYE